MVSSTAGKPQSVVASNNQTQQQLGPSSNPSDRNLSSASPTTSVTRAAQTSSGTNDVHTVKRKRAPSKSSTRPGPVMVDGKKRYPCGVCDMTFSTSGHAARHSRIHRGARPYVCTFPGCGNRFSRQDNSLQHYKTHVTPACNLRGNELGYLLKSAAEIAQEEELIELGKKALLGGTAIAVMREVCDDKGKRTGEKMVRSVGAYPSTRLPGVKLGHPPQSVPSAQAGPSSMHYHAPDDTTTGSLIPMSSVNAQPSPGTSLLTNSGSIGATSSGAGGGLNAYPQSGSVANHGAYGSMIRPTGSVDFPEPVNQGVPGFGNGPPTAPESNTSVSMPNSSNGAQEDDMAFSRTNNYNYRVVPIGPSGNCRSSPLPRRTSQYDNVGAVPSGGGSSSYFAPSAVRDLETILPTRPTYTTTLNPNPSPASSASGTLLQSPGMSTNSNMYVAPSNGPTGPPGLSYTSWNADHGNHRYDLHYSPPSASQPTPGAHFGQESSALALHQVGQHSQVKSAVTGQGGLTLGVWRPQESMQQRPQTALYNTPSHHTPASPHCGSKYAMVSPHHGGQIVHLQLAQPPPGIGWRTPRNNDQQFRHN